MWDFEFCIECHKTNADDIEWDVSYDEYDPSDDNNDDDDDDANNT